jgi:hypothetical protein
MVVGRGEVNRKTKVRADADRPRDELRVYSGDFYQDSVEIPEPDFPLGRWYGCLGMAWPAFAFFVSS